MRHSANLAIALALGLATWCYPQGENGVGPLNNLTGPYTLTAYAPGNCEYNGLKAEIPSLFQSKVAAYCPFTGNQSSICPNGTDAAFAGTLYPVCGGPISMYLC